MRSGKRLGRRAIGRPLAKPENAGRPLMRPAKQTGHGRWWGAIDPLGEISISFICVADFQPKLSASPPQERRDIEAVPRFGVGVGVTGFGVGWVWGIVGLLLRMRAPPH